MNTGATGHLHFGPTAQRPIRCVMTTFRVVGQFESEGSSDASGHYPPVGRNGDALDAATRQLEGLAGLEVGNVRIVVRRQDGKFRYLDTTRPDDAGRFRIRP